jgi:hypothetical protein
MELSLHNRIRQRAHELWNAGGRLDGQAEQRWLAAERDVLEQMSAEGSCGDHPSFHTSPEALGNKECAEAAKEGLSKKAATAETLTI